MMSSTPSWTVSPTPGAATADPTHIGPYRILEKLGEGGMGSVYLAEQEKPLKRMVAVKVIKLGMDTRDVVARFEAERQALARMDHPNIAAVYDAGATPDGRPYFVMERVLGVPITEFCDGVRLPTRARLELFMDVCAAIQHAHQKGIIHRDIKPSNVLVSEHDGKPVPKVIDFGVAKATGERLADDQQKTALGLFIGTPEYMSPEQAGITEQDVDSRTDIYSLGILLYELLVGTVPFESKRLRQTGYAEIQRIIREEEPARPSTRLTSIGASATEVADRRLTNTPDLGRELRGDLDWIALKAIEKDRSRRYQSASEFAADIARHLHDEPVVARPPSVAYRTKKFVTRNRIGVAAAAIVLLAVVAGLITSTALYFRAERAKQYADTQRVAAEQQKAAADEQRGRAESQRVVADAAKQDAETQRGVAQHEAQAATVANLQAQTQRTLAERRACAASVLAADSQLRAANRLETRRRLDACPPDLRGWEWSYVDRRVDSSDLSVRGGGRVTQVQFSSDGKSVRALVLIAGRNALVAAPSGKADGPVTAVRVADGSELAASADGRLAVVSTWTAGGVQRVAEPSGFLATDGRPQPAGPPADLVRLRDLVSKRDVATLTLNTPSRVVGATDATFQTSPRAALTQPLASFLPGGISAALTAAMAALVPAAAASTPPGGPGSAPAGPAAPQAIPTEAEIATQVALMQKAFGSVGMGKGPTVTVSGTYPYIADAAFSADGKKVAAWSWSNEIGVWDTATGRQVATLKGATDGISSAAFSPDNTQLVSASFDGTVRVWNIALEKVIGTLAGHTGAVMSVAVNPLGRVATGSTDGSVRVWDLKTLQQVWRRDDAGSTRSVAFSPDGHWLASAAEELVHVWDAASGFGVARLTGATGRVNAVAFSPDSRSIVSGGDDQNMRVWNIGAAGLSIIGRHEDGTGAIGLAWGSDNDRLASVATGVLRLWRTSSPELIRTLRPVQPAPGLSSVVAPRVTMAVSGDATLVASATSTPLPNAAEDKVIRLWDTTTGQPAGLLEGFQTPISTLALSRDGRAALSVSTNGSMRVWETRPAKLIASAESADSVVRPLLTSDGRWVVSGASTTRITIRDARTLQVARTISNHGRSILGLALSPDETRLVLSDGKLVAVLDFATGAVVNSVSVTESVSSFAYSSDGARIAGAVSGGTAGGTIRVWDARTLETAITLTDDPFVHAPPIAAANSDSLAFLGRSFSMAFVMTPSTTHQVSALVFSPDGRRLASSWDDGTIRVYDASPKTPYQQARDLVNRFTLAGEFRDEIIENIRADRTLSPETRDFAIRFMDRPANPNLLNSAAFRVVMTPDGDPEDYRLALRRAEAAMRLLDPPTTAPRTPDEARALATPTQLAQTLNTLAFAQYRVGRYRDALDTVKRSSAIRPGDPYDLALSAMAHLRLGVRSAAQADLDALDKVVAAAPKTVTPTMSPAERTLYIAMQNPDLKGIIAEAKALAQRLARR
jgi:eukaryotic-like serine/threonine-protein kinase